MQSPTLLVLALTFLGSGCALLGFGPPTSRIVGWVYSLEGEVPLPRADVCALGRDTTCVRADGKGRYALKLTAQTVVLRFRYGSLPPAESDSIHLRPPQGYTVNCALTNRLVLSDRAVACQPVAAR